MPPLHSSSWWRSGWNPGIGARERRSSAPDGSSRSSWKPLPSPTPEEVIQLAFCCLEETIARTAYRRANPAHPFDDGAGHRLPGCQKAMLERIPDGRFRSLAGPGLLG